MKRMPVSLDLNLFRTMGWIFFSIGIATQSGMAEAETNTFAVKIPKAKTAPELGKGYEDQALLLDALDKALKENKTKTLFAIDYTSLGRFGADVVDERHRLVYDVERKLLIYLHSEDRLGREPVRGWLIFVNLLPQDWGKVPPKNWEKEGRFPKYWHKYTPVEMRENPPEYYKLGRYAIDVEESFDAVCNSCAIHYPQHPRLLKFP